MLDHQGSVIYVGKAKNLKKRVSSYFYHKNLDKKTTQMIRHVCDIQVTVTEDEVSALLLEANLIKQYRPKYNVLLRDDKSYPFLSLSVNHAFPRLYYSRDNQSSKGQLFGPYPNAGSVRENLAMIQKLFKLRQCSDSFFKNRSRPCLQYQIQRCTAPCVGLVSQEDYALQVRQAVYFLQGKDDQVMEALTQQMQAASERQAYEEAGIYRDQITRLRKLQSSQAIQRVSGDVDVFSYMAEADKHVMVVLFVRAGRVLGYKALYPRVSLNIDSHAMFEQFLLQYYLSPVHAHTELDAIVLPVELTDKSVLEKALAGKVGAACRIIDKPSAKYQQWRRMAADNAKQVLEASLADIERFDQQFEALREALSMTRPIELIECFDISHTQGEATVASCVVYGQHGAEKKSYRRFNIKHITGGDDYAAMRQALQRRYERLKKNDSPLPDLVLIDGGVGQLRCAIEVFEELQLSGVTLVGVAKGVSRKPGEERIFIAGSTLEMKLPADSMALHLIQQVRDEAHRFAIQAHRKQRADRRVRSPLQDIPGVGVKRRNALLAHFGGFQALSQASIVEISRVKGISLSLAEKIYKVLH